MVAQDDPHKICLFGKKEPITGEVPMKQLKKPLIITLTSLIGVAILDLTLLIFVPSVRAMFTGYEYDVFPTCTEDGYRYYHSPDGNEYPIGRYLATGHDYIAAVTAPHLYRRGLYHLYLHHLHP